MNDFDHSALETPSDQFTLNGSQISVFNEADGLMYDFATIDELEAWSLDGDDTALRTRPPTAQEIAEISDVSVSSFDF